MRRKRAESLLQLLHQKSQGLPGEESEGAPACGSQGLSSFFGQGIESGILSQIDRREKIKQMKRWPQGRLKGQRLSLKQIARPPVQGSNKNVQTLTIFLSSKEILNG